MGIVWALGAAVTWGISDFFGGLAESRTEDDRTAAIVAWTMGLGLVGLFGLALLVEGTLPVPDAVLAGLGGVGGAVGVGVLYRGLSIGTISVVAPITGVLAASLPVLVGVLQGERPAPLVWVGIVAALGSIVLVAREEPVDGTRPFNRRAMVYAVGAGFGFATIFLVLDAMPDGSGLWPLIPLKLGGLLAAIAWIAVGRQPARPGPGTGALVLGVGLLDNAANVAYLFASRTSLLSIVAVLASLYPAFTVLLARVVLHERLQRVQLVGLALSGIGVGLIAAG